MLMKSIDKEFFPCILSNLRHTESSVYLYIEYNVLQLFQEYLCLAVKRAYKIAVRILVYLKVITKC